MRLIDADKLIEVLRKNSIFRTVTNAEDKSVIKIIEEQPTAFDVDKVVEELEELSNTSKTKPTDLGFVDEYKWIFFNDAIDIVKAGGKDE